MIKCLCVVLSLCCAFVMWVPQSAVAEDLEEQEHHFLLGFKDKAYRTPEQAKALATRVHKRLHAARVPDFRVEVDAGRSEVSVKIHTTLSADFLRKLLMARGGVELVPESRAPQELAGLGDLLPPTITLGHTGETLEALKAPPEDLFLHAQDRRALETFVGALAFPSTRLLVGRFAHNQGAEGWRTWAVGPSDARLTQLGLREVKINAGSHPNYYYVSVWWGELTQEEAGGATAHSQGGQEGLEALTTRYQGRRFLLLIDGRLALVVGLLPEIREGKLTLKLPTGTSRDQLHTARQIAAMMAASPHPCPLVNIKTTP